MAARRSPTETSVSNRSRPLRGSGKGKLVLYPLQLASQCTQPISGSLAWARVQSRSFLRIWRFTVEIGIGRSMQSRAGLLFPQTCGILRAKFEISGCAGAESAVTSTNSATNAACTPSSRSPAPLPKPQARQLRGYEHRRSRLQLCSVGRWRHRGEMVATAWIFRILLANATTGRLRRSVHRGLRHPGI